MKSAVILGLLLMAAGCLGTAPGLPEEAPATAAEGRSTSAGGGATRTSPPTSPTEPAPPPSDDLSFDAPLAVFSDCGQRCYEMSVAVDTAGRIFVTTALGDRLAVSEDGGRSFARLDPPPLPKGALEGAIGMDAVVQTDPGGRLFFVFPAAKESSSPKEIRALHGIQVAYSLDGGKTWPSNTFVSVLGDSPHTSLLTDRPWLGFGPNGVVYLSYNELSTAIWIARSDDGGKSFGPFMPVVQTDGVLGPTAAGPPVVDSEGRILLPFRSPAGSKSTTVDQGPGAALVQVAISEDGGKTFRHVVAGPSGFDFPMLTLDEADVATLAWQHYENRVAVTRSSDHGATWSAPAFWTKGMTSAASPWARSRGGDLHMAWFEDHDGGSYTLWFGKGPASAATSKATVPVASLRSETGDPNTDFAQFAWLPDGRAVTVWSDRETDAGFVAVQRA